MRKRRGAALTITLAALFLTCGMVAMSLSLAERIAEVLQFRVNDELLLNAAVAGVQRGKAMLATRFASDDMLPRRPRPDSALSAEDLQPPFVALKIEGFEDIAFVDPLGVEVIVTVYDLCYETVAGVPFLSGVPPRISSERASGLASLSEGALQRQGYASANLAGASSAAISDGSRTGRAYLVRSVATLGFLSKTAEQALVLWE